MSRQIASGDAFGKKYEVYVRSGAVEGTEIRAETEVRGQISGGGGLTVGGSGGNAPVSGQVESRTTRYQNIYLTDEEGVEHAIELVDFVVPCKQGQKLSLFLVAGAGSDRGAWFHAYNHNTRQHYRCGPALRGEMFPKWILAGLLALVVVMTWNAFSASPGNDGFEVFFGTAIVAGLIGAVLYGVARIFAAVRGARVRGNLAWKQYIAGLAS